MSKFFKSKIALPVAVFTMGIGSAFAALNCTTPPSCVEMGYSADSVDGCESYVYCPFDTSYKACVKFGVQECTSGYARAAENCGKQGAEGWELGLTSDEVGCFNCVVKTCPTGTSTTLRPVSPQNEDGTTVQVIKAYSGDKACVQTDTCDLNYAYADKGCGTNMEMGTRKGKLLKGINGDRQCYQCVCKEGYTDSFQDGKQVCIKVSFIKCLGYPLTSCSSPAMSCDECQDGDKTKYKAVSCARGYMVSAGKCEPRDCSAYPLASCPVGGICMNCVSAGKQTYQLAACEDGFTLIETAGGKSCALSTTTCDGIWCTGPSGERRCFKSNPCVTEQTCPWECGGLTTNNDGGSSSSGSGGGGSICAEECQPNTMNSCECKLCQDGNYCINGAGASGRDPMCCQIDEFESSMDRDPSLRT